MSEHGNTRNLLCSCCGGRTRGRQWPNRDTGYGMCGDCITKLRAKGYTEAELRSLYGIEGVHFNVKELQT